MAAGLAQEISDPVNTILGHVRLLESRLANEDQGRFSLEAIEREALHCQTTIQSLLDFAKRPPPEPGPIDVNELLEVAWRKVDDDLPVHSIEIVRGFDPHLPLVQADRKQMEQALVQLIRNACEAMDLDGTLRLISRSVASEVQIIVADTGRGLSPEQLRHIFDPFYSTNEQGQQAGLGLSIAYGVIESNGGTIEVESQEGRGTTFTIHLPLETDLE
jgi:two-component system NtrC family sensor kinase